MPDWQTVVQAVTDSSPSAVMTAVMLWAFVAMFRRFVVGDSRWLDKPAAERLREVTDGGPMPTLTELMARLLRMDEKLDAIGARVERLEQRFDALPFGAAPVPREGGAA